MDADLKITNMHLVAEYRNKLLKEPVLKTLFFELTDACNLSCVHCGSSSGPNNGTYIPEYLVRRVLDDVADKYDSSNILIAFTGGEPLLHPSFFDLVKYATSLGFTCGVTTNAVLIDNACAAKMKKSGVRSVSVSIDGTEKTHDKFRGKNGAYSRAMAGLRSLVKVGGIYTQITTVVHHNNISLLDEMYEEAVKSGVHSWRPINIEPIGRAKLHEELALSAYEHRYLLEYIQKKRSSPDTKINVSYGCSHYLGAEFEAEVRDFYFLCVAGIQVASVTAKGDITACLDIERRDSLVFGNVTQDSFTQVWENSFEPFRCDRSEQCDECLACNERKFCQGDSAHTWDFDNSRPQLCLRKKL